MAQTFASPHCPGLPNWPGRCLPKGLMSTRCISVQNRYNAKQQEEKTVANMLHQLSDEMADLVDGAAGSVLRVDARRRIAATGIAWAHDLVVTAHHVVESDADISVGLPDGGQASMLS